MVLIEGLSRFWLHLCVNLINIRASSDTAVLCSSVQREGLSLSGNPQSSLDDLCAEYMTLIESRFLWGWKIFITSKVDLDYIQKKNWSSLGGFCLVGFCLDLCVCVFFLLIVVDFFLLFSFCCWIAVSKDSMVTYFGRE